MSSNSSKPAFYKNEITEEDIEILKDIFEKIEKDKNAFSFLEPVDYVALNLPDYPKIIKHPMDLGTCKNNLLNGKYKIFQEFMDDLHLIWENCRTYNQQKSEIVKCGNACEKKLRALIEKKWLWAFILILSIFLTTSTTGIALSFIMLGMTVLNQKNIKGTFFILGMGIMFFIFEKL